MTRRSDNRSLYVCRASLACAASMVLALTANSAIAQTSSYQPATDSVVINWGAIDGGTAAPGSGNGAMPQSAPAGNGNLLMPGPRMPHSQLHVTVPGGNSSSVTLRKPGGAAQARSQPKPAPKPAVEPAETPDAPKQLAEKPAAQPKKEAKQEPKQMPKAPEPETKSAPPPPPATESASAPPPPPPAPEPIAAPEAKKQPEKAKDTEQASVPPAAESDGSGATKVLFNDSDTKLTADGQSILNGVLGELEKSNDLRVQLMAYAAGDDLTSSKARRISLSRALSVRSYLIEKGLRSTRIDVRALGDKAEDDPKNRVDVNIVER